MQEKVLQNKTAVITGGSRGLGKSIALKLAQNGADVVINYVSDNNNIEETLDEIRAFGVKAMAIKADISDYSQAEEMINKAKAEFGSIDILVNNAGITKDNLILKMKEEDFDKVININLKGTFNCIKHITPIMLKQRHGKIVNISSIIGISGNIGQINYAASKAGIIGMTKSAAKELASRGINVNAVAPGFIETDMTAVLNDKVKEEALNSIPFKKLGKPEDVANAVLFLTSELSDYITGQVIKVDGGMNM